MQKLRKRRGTVRWRRY